MIYWEEFSQYAPFSMYERKLPQLYLLPPNPRPTTAHLQDVSSMFTT